MDTGTRRDAFCHLLDLYGPALSGRCKDVMELYYEEDLSLSEIAENCGITRQGVHDAIRRGETDLLLWERKLHFANMCNRILELTDALKARSGDPEIRRLADDISAAVTRETEESDNGNVFQSRG